MSSIRPARVLVTRAPHQASELADRLRSLGVEPVLIPSIETVEPHSFAALDAALTHLDSFHWLLFTSANAVEAFHHRLTHLKLSISSEATERSEDIKSGNLLLARGATDFSRVQLRVAVIGPATARAARALGLEPDLIPPQAVAESFTQALLPYAVQPDGTATRFLLVRAEEAREHLPETLRAAGAEVTVAPAYRTVIPATSIQTIRSVFNNIENYPEAITFTSSSTARNLVALCEAADVLLPDSILRISIGPITSQTLSELGIPPHAEAPEATVLSLAEIVVKTLRGDTSA